MQYPKKCEIEQAASKDPSRFALTQVYFRRGRLIATNGAIAVRIPVPDCKKDTKGFIPIPAVLKARKAKNLFDTTEITATDVVRVSSAGGMVEFKREQEVTFPNIKAVMPKPKEAKFTIVLSAQELIRAFKAMGAHKSDDFGVVFHFYDSEKPILLHHRMDVEVPGKEEGKSKTKKITVEAAVMPMKEVRPK